MQLRFYAMLRQIVGGKTVDFDLSPGATASTLLGAVTERFPEMARYVWDERGGLAEHIRVFVDGREIRHLQGLDTPIPPGAELDIFPPSAGG